MSTDRVPLLFNPFRVDVTHDGNFCDGCYGCDSGGRCSGRHYHDLRIDEDSIQVSGILSDLCGYPTSEAVLWDSNILHYLGYGLLDLGSADTYEIVENGSPWEEEFEIRLVDPDGIERILAEYLLTH